MAPQRLLALLKTKPPGFRPTQRVSWDDATEYLGTLSSEYASSALDGGADTFRPPLLFLIVCMFLFLCGGWMFAQAMPPLSHRFTHKDA